MNFEVVSRSGKVLFTKLSVEGKTTNEVSVDEVMKAIHKSNKKLHPTRQRLQFGDKVLQKGTKLSEYEGLKSGGRLVLKDLGPQIGWSTVFLIEYAGPIFLYSMFYFFPRVFYRGYKDAQYDSKTPVQNAMLAIMILHFLKREYETLYVHRFSSETMPLANLPKNCFHYWFFSGLNMGYWINTPGFKSGFLDVFLNFGMTEAVNSNMLLLLSLLALWVFSEVSNFITHCTLRDLRPPGSRVRKIPRGYGFNSVSCPNYYFEVLGWFVATLISGSISSWFFFIIGAGQMWVWAVKKHRRYIMEFGKEYPSRKVMIPYVF